MASNKMATTTLKRVLKFIIRMERMDGFGEMGENLLGRNKERGET